LTANRGTAFGRWLFLVALAVGWLSVGSDASEHASEARTPADSADSISDSPFWIIGSQRAAALIAPERDALGSKGDPPGASPDLPPAFREPDSAPDFLRCTPSRTPRLGGGIAPARAPPVLIG